MNRITHHLSSPWFAISLAVAGMITGYTMVVVRADVVGGAEFCPVEICQGNDCDHKPECAHGLCTEDCAGNCTQKHS